PPPHGGAPSPPVAVNSLPLRRPGRWTPGRPSGEASPAMAPPSATAAADGREERLRQLRTARLRASALLLAVTGVFLGVTAAGVHGTIAGYVQAGAEAAMVGGVADWFAVTALFRRPLGLPIPHTAIIVERKDQFAATLGSFVQENFLNGDVLAERIGAAHVVPRLAAWLTDESNASRFSAHVADLAVEVAELMRDEEVHRVLAGELSRAVDAVPVAPLAGRGLRAVTAGDRHAELFDTLVEAADRYLADNYVGLRRRFRAESPSWIPEAVDRLVFDRLHSRLRRWLATVKADPTHDARRQFGEWVSGVSDRLENSPEMRERGERLKHDMLAHAELRELSSSLWRDAKTTLRDQASRPDSELRQRLARGLVAAGRRLEGDPRLRDSLERAAESAARALADQFQPELAGLVSGTIERWDAAETAGQLELLLGRDLQFIRINGTVVGAAVGLSLHAAARALG
ncbi:MAG TPA: DUF445 domain-containing protein, partial [Acidimicrobiales bacterium]|nr:DUF445 domain-containing protein [Acidimicrobiales bacterium]